MKVGDRAVVCSERYTEQNGLTCVITSVTQPGSLPVTVIYDDTPENNSHPHARMYANGKIGNWPNSYSKKCLIPFDPGSPCDAGALEYEEIMELFR